MDERNASKEEKTFWADGIAKQVSGKQLVSDAKTPSGPIHVGSLRGVIIHDLAYKSLLDAGKEAEFIYRFDDLDPMDGFPTSLDESFRKYMGQPLCNIPSPEEGYESFAQCYAQQFVTAFEKIGCTPKIHWSSEFYRAGKMNEVLKIALEKSSQIKEINERVSGTKKQDNWLPINVVCEKCGHIGGTVASDFDGKTVAYECAGANYCDGCKHKGRISPFDGNAKATWKLDWALSWKVLGVTVEGAGKDHAAAGGSRAVANEISNKIFHYPAPYDFPYEHFLLGGKKMSTSKGIGISVKDIVELLPPELLRFLMMRYKPRTAIDFNPAGEAVPRLFDDYDAFGEAFFGRKAVRDPDEPRIFQLSQVSEIARKSPADFYRASFSLVAGFIQIPHLDVKKIIEGRKGAALNKLEEIDLQQRILSAKVWLEKYASEEDKVTILSHAEAVKNFTELPAKMQACLHEFAEVFGRTEKEDDQWSKIKELCATNGFSIKDFFQAAYLILLGKKSGPKLLSFLNALDKNFVVGRFTGVH